MNVTFNLVPFNLLTLESKSMLKLGLEVIHTVMCLNIYVHYYMYVCAKPGLAGSKVLI